MVTPGESVSHYRVLERLGGGGMGVVYKAEDTRLHRQVALKFLPEEFTRDRQALERFHREAYAASALNHPNICTIHDIDEHQGQPFIAMELLEGQTLRERLSARPLTRDEALDMAMQITDALEAAHAKGIVHRDVKPGNIMVNERGQVKILDFGLAKLAREGAGGADTGAVPQSAAPSPDTAARARDSLSRGGFAVGTPAYMSPEQAAGEDLDPRTDLFSLGAVLYEMATRRRAFDGDSPAAILEKVLTETPPPPGLSNAEFPPAFDAIVCKLLERDRDLRYQTAADVRADLKRLRRDSGSSSTFTRLTGAALPRAQAERPGSRGRLARTSRTVRWNLAAGLVLLLALGAGALVRFSSHPSGLTEKDTVVLADFANSTGDPVFDDTLKTALSVALDQSPFLNVLPEAKVATTLKLMTRPASTTLTPEAAREVCQRTGSKAYLAGSIDNLGSQYVVGLTAVNCQTGDLLAQEQATAPAKEQVLAMVGKMAAKLRGELGESLATVQKFDVPLEQATTSSLPALQAYSLGREAHDEKGPAAALPYHLRAIQLDPTFAMGYGAVGGDYSNLGELGRASVYFTKAFELREHASEREKLIITADYYSNVTGQLAQAAQAYQEILQTYPRDTVASDGLGVIYTMEGEYAKATDAYRRSSELDPDRAFPYVNLANCLLALGQFDEAQATIRGARARKLDPFIFHLQLYALGFLKPEPAAMAEQLRWFAGRPEENFGLTLAADTAAFHGRLREARKLAAQSVEAALRADSPENGAIWRENAALREAAFGNALQARQDAAEGLKLSPSSQGVGVQAALAYAMAGESSRAESLAHELNQRFPTDTQVQSLWLPAIRAQIELNRQKPRKALEELQAATGPVEFGQLMFVENTSCLYPTYVRGQAYLAAGQGPEASAEFQKISGHRGLVWNCWTGALAHLGMARANALEAANSRGAVADSARTRALAAYRGFLALWKDADPDIPVLLEARKEYIKLQ